MAQVGHLAELKRMSSVPVEILGINAAGHEYWNEDATASHDLPWLQDYEDIDVWGVWDIRYRDVVVVDADGYPASTYNLTSHDLADPDSQAHLAGLIEAAQ